MTTLPEPGKLIQLRGRPAVVQSVVPHDANGAGRRHLVTVDYVDEHPYPDQDTVLWEVEPEIKVRQTQGWPPVRYTAPDAPDHYRAYVDAIRWTSLQSMEAFLLKDDQAPLVSPWSAAVQVEDYQLVPLLKALSMPRVSLLLADDVGLGKTIQAGLIATELMVRRNIRRTLIVCPASLQYQWQQEMKEKFHLDFTVMDSDQIRKIQLEHGSDVNPWGVHNRVITSMDFLKQDLVREQFDASLKRLQDEVGPGRHPWDLLVVDEAHNLAPRRFGDDSMRTRMMRELTFHFEHRLFLTATPHNGFVESFTGLLELLDPYRFIQKQQMTEQDRSHRDAVMVRRLKREINAASSSPRFPHRERPMCVPVHYTPEERRVWQALRDYRDSAYKHLQKDGGRANLGQFLFSLLMKRLLSSPYAFAKTWWAHVATSDDGGIDEAEKARRRAEEDTGDDVEQADRERTAAEQAGTWLFREAPTLRDPAEAVSQALRDLGWDEKTTAEGPSAGHDIPDGKWQATLEHIRKGAQLFDAPRIDALIGPPSKLNDERLLLFTEYRDTQALILERLAHAGYKDETVRSLYGGMGSAERDDIKVLFNHPDSKLRILVATDAASEGLNLQKKCRTVAHYDIPWNPMRLEQRNGRVDRHGQPAEVVRIFHYNSTEDEDDEFLRRLINKVDQAREDLGSVEAVIDSEIHDRLVLGNHQTRWEDFSVEVDERSATPVELEGDAPTEAEFLQAKHQFDASSEEYGLTVDGVENVLRWFLTRHQGASLREGENGLEIIGARGRVKKLLDRHVPMLERGRPTLVFDPDDYLVQRGERRVYEPRYGTQLIRMGHPLAQAALHHYRRLLWNPMDSDLQRWSMQAVKGTEAYLAFDFLVTVRNRMQETIHSRVETRWLHVAGGQLQRARDPGLDVLGPATGTGLDTWRERIGQALAVSLSSVTAQLELVAEGEAAAWKDRLADAKVLAKEEYGKAFDKQIRDLRRLGVSEHEARLREMLAKAKQEASQSRLVASTRERFEARVRELQDQLKPENLQVWSKNQETQAGRLEREKQRFMEHVLPKRYALRDAANPRDIVEVVEVGIRAFVPEVSS